MLNKNSVIPLYVQLQDILKDAILSGQYKQNECIPSENVLSRRYGITRSTVRKAISQLVSSGYLRKEHGKGSFVALRQIQYSMWNFGGFTDFMKKQKKVPYSRVLENKVVNFEGRKFLRLKRARGVEEGQIDFLTLDTSLLPLDVFPGLDAYDFSRCSLYNTMREKYNVHPERVDVGVYPENASDLALRLFNLNERIPLLRIKGRVYSSEGADIEQLSILYSPKVDFKLITVLE